MDATIYKAHGYINRKDYLTHLAEDYGIDIQTVCLTAGLLGSSEDFDGLISMLEDMSDSMDTA